MDQIARLWQNEPPSLAHRSTVVNDVFMRFTPFGPANFLYSDGDYLYAFANMRTQENGKIEPPGLYYLCRHCAFDPNAIPLSGAQLEGDIQKIVLFASVPLSDEDWVPFERDQLIVTRGGQIQHQALEQRTRG